MMTSFSPSLPYGLHLTRDTVTLPPAGLLTVQEVFSSVQGEAAYVGVRQVFIRLAHCHLKCAYCDTTMTSPQGRAWWEPHPGSGQRQSMDNPLSVEQVLGLVKTVSGDTPHHSVSLTGGEPLLYAESLTQLMPALQAMGLKTYLETSGTQPQALASVLPYTDIIAMDIKLSSATGEPWRGDQHRAFYEVARSRPQTETFAKLIVNQQTTLEELALLPDCLPDRTLEIFLQPETDLKHPSQLNCSPSHLLTLQTFLLETYYERVRVIPQLHKWLNVS